MNYMLPEYEKNCVVEYVPIGEEKLIFGNSTDTKINEALLKIVFYCFFKKKNFKERNKLTAKLL